MKAIYARVSTEEQNLDGQVAMLNERVTKESWDARQFIDNGHSGDTVARPALKALRQEIARGNVEVVVVFRLDRLSRRTATGIKLLHDWIATGVRVVSVMEGIDIDPGNPDMAGIVIDVVVPLLFGLAQNEQRVRRQRQAAGIAAAKRKGVYRGRKPGSTTASPRRAQELRRKGLKDGEIAQSLGVSRRTVQRYLAVKT